MDLRFHGAAEGGIHRSLTLEQRFATEHRGDDHHVEVAAARRGAGMADVLGALIVERSRVRPAATRRPW
jgi:hypothetical protein